MNKYKEALFRMSKVEDIDSSKFDNEYSVDDYVEDGLIIFELLDKETPMKPIHLGDNKYSCNKCAMAFELETKTRFVNNQYCDVCGQKLDWGEEHE